MKILLDDQGDRIRVVENQELGYYELRFGRETAGTLDYRDMDDRRVFGLTGSDRILAGAVWRRF